jgi:hypothetical protein
MSLPQPTNKEFEVFNQREYNNTFFCCDNNHPFIAFTTCFCPMCDLRASYKELFIEKENVESELFELEENYYSLVGKVKKHAPELLI